MVGWCYQLTISSTFPWVINGAFMHLQTCRKHSIFANYLIFGRSKTGSLRVKGRVEWVAWSRTLGLIKSQVFLFGGGSKATGNALGKIKILYKRQCELKERQKAKQIM
jgi:hypothetical protein